MLHKLDVISNNNCIGPCNHSDLRLTYHLGDDRSWQGSGATNRKLSLQNIKNAYSSEVWSNLCMFQISDYNFSQRKNNVVYEGNSLPCTRLAYKFWCEEYDPCKVANCTRSTNLIARSAASCAATTKLGYNPAQSLAQQPRDNTAESSSVSLKMTKVAS